MRAILAITLAVFGGLANACPFCTATGQSLFSEVDQADFIVVGKLTNPVRDPDDILKGTTDLVIERVVKPHSYLTGRTTLRLPRYIPVDEKDDTLELVFCSLYLRPVDMAQAALVSTAHLAKSDSWKLDPYRGEKVASQGKTASLSAGCDCPACQTRSRALALLF